MRKAEEARRDKKISIQVHLRPLALLAADPAHGSPVMGLLFEKERRI
jgi:hypothetical protein